MWWLIKCLFFTISLTIAQGIFCVNLLNQFWSHDCRFCSILPHFCQWSRSGLQITAAWFRKSIWKSSWLSRKNYAANVTINRSGVLADLTGNICKDGTWERAWHSLIWMCIFDNGATWESLRRINFDVEFRIDAQNKQLGGSDVVVFILVLQKEKGKGTQQFKYYSLGNGVLKFEIWMRDQERSVAWEWSCCQSNQD